MTRIDCVAARDKGIPPRDYIGRYVGRHGYEVFVATDEEENDYLRLDIYSAAHLARVLLKLVEEIRVGWECEQRRGAGDCHPDPR